MEYADEIATQYREEARAEQLLVTVDCRLCGEDVPEEEILADGVCCGCAADYHLVRCDWCGRLLPQCAAVEELRDLAGGGQRHDGWYCHLCVRERAHA